MWKGPCDADGRLLSNLHIWRLEGNAVAVAAEEAPTMWGAKAGHCRARAVFPVLVALQCWVYARGLVLLQRHKKPQWAQRYVSIWQSTDRLHSYSFQLLSRSGKDFLLFQCAVQVNSHILPSPGVWKHPARHSKVKLNDVQVFYRKWTIAFPCGNFSLLKLGEEHVCARAHARACVFTVKIWDCLGVYFCRGDTRPLAELTSSFTAW